MDERQQPQQSREPIEKPPLAASLSIDTCTDGGRPPEDHPEHPADMRQVIDLQNRRWAVLSALAWVGGFFVTVALIGLALISLGLGVGGMIAVILCIAAGSIAWAFVSVKRRSAKVERALIDDGTTFAERFRRAVATGRIRTGWFSHDEPIKVVFQLAQPGTVVRVHRGRHAPLVRPISMQFEPRPLNEGLEQFWDLERATIAEEPGRAPDDGVNREHNAIVRRLHRGVALAGGWWLILFMLVVFGLMILSFAKRGLVRHNYYLDIKGALIAIVVAKAIFMPASGDPWVVVPGAVAMREKIPFTKTAPLVYLEARKSMLVAYQRPASQSWIVHIAEKPTQVMKTTLTTNEVNLLLGAWMSDQLSPPREHLTDI